MNRIYFLLLALAACAFTPVGAQAQQLLSPLVNTTSYAPSNVVVPWVPQTLEFAGERVPLEYYDTRESLEREMATSVYMHSRTLQTLLNTTRYFPIIEPILAKNGIPADFKYLCVAESGLNPNVVSTAGAAGLWQIMSTTGKSQGLIVTAELDERYHIEKATQIACIYLKDAYKKFGSWSMAAASYNVGVAGLSKRVEKQGTANYYDTYLPEETMRYVFRILSLKLIIENPQRYGFLIAPEQYHKPLDNYKEVDVAGAKIIWAEVAAKYGTNYKMLRELNPWIRDYEYTNTFSRTFKVKIPQKGFRE